MHRAGKHLGGLLTQFVFGVLFSSFSSGRPSIKGAYDVLVSMGVITYFLPYFTCSADVQAAIRPAGQESFGYRRKTGRQAGCNRPAYHNHFDDWISLLLSPTNPTQSARRAQDRRIIGLLGLHRRGYFLTPPGLRRRFRISGTARRRVVRARSVRPAHVAAADDRTSSTPRSEPAGARIRMQPRIFAASM